MLSGEGALQWGGRWNSPGVAAVYCSENLSQCALEILVHLPSRVMRRYRYIELTVPDANLVPVDRPPGEEAAMQVLGDRLLGADGELAFLVPSRVNRLERNLVLNPLHASASGLTCSEPAPFPMDERLFR